MSRIGGKSIAIPQGVEVKCAPGMITVKGPKGELKQKIHQRIKIPQDQSHIKVERNDNDGFSKALHGLTRSQVANMITGVSKGFEKVLEISGVGLQTLDRSPLQPPNRTCLLPRSTAGRKRRV